MPQVIDGFIDLSTWDFEKDGIAKLDGNWDFYWQQLIEPEEFKDNNQERKTSFSVPGIWNDVEIDGKELGENGYATVRLRIKTNGKKTRYAIRIERVESAAKFWVNGQLLIKQGEVSTTREAQKGLRLPTDVSFAARDTIEIVAQITNFKHRFGGIFNSVLFAKPEQIRLYADNRMAFDLFLFGVLLVMGIYHLGLFVLRRKDYSPLFFAMVALLTALHMSTNSEYFLDKIYHNFDWEIFMKIDYFPNYLRVAFFGLFIGALFPKEISRKFIFGITAVLSALGLLILLTPARIYTFTLLSFEIIILILFVYLMYGLVLASVKKREGAIYSLLGTLLLLVTGVNDILYEMQIINSIYLVPFGIFIFIFFQSFMLSVRFSKAFFAEKLLAERLKIFGKIKDGFLADSSHSLEAPLSVIVQNTGAKKAVLVLKKSDNWLVDTVIGCSQKIDKQTKLDTLQEGEIGFPVDLVQQSISQQKLLIVNPKNKKLQKISGAYITKNQIDSALCMPLFQQKKIAGVLYLEGEDNNNILGAEVLNVLNLLSSELMTLIDNSQIYSELYEFNKTLEEKVKLRAHEVIRQKDELQVQAQNLQQTNIELSDRQEKIQQQSEEILMQSKDLQEANKLLKKQHTRLEHQNQYIGSSINYAKTIQQAILPFQANMKATFDYFLLYRPKDVISGDFYWLTKIDDGIIEKNFIAVVDCTGHGVPGAFLSIIGSRLLRETIVEKRIYDPKLILERLDKGIKLALKQKHTENQDGMDVCLCLLEKQLDDSTKVTFSGAKRPLYYYDASKSEMNVLKGTRRSIGGWRQARRKIEFESEQIIAQSGDIIYLTSDGYITQNAPNRKSFGSERLIGILQRNAYLELAAQQKVLENTLDTYAQNEDQRDDITILGIKL